MSTNAILIFFPADLSERMIDGVQKLYGSDTVVFTNRRAFTPEMTLGWHLLIVAGDG